MVKMPGKGPLRGKFRRKPQPIGSPEPLQKKEIPKHVKKLVKAIALALFYGRSFLRALAALPGKAFKKKLPSENAVRFKRGGANGKRIRALTFSGCAVVVTVLLLLILLAPESAAEPSNPETAVKPVALIATPVPTTQPDAFADPIPTTAPDIAPTPTPKPKATPKPKPKASATPKPDATPKPPAASTPAPQKPVSTVAPPAVLDYSTMPPPAGADMASLVACFAVSSETYYDSVGYSSNHYDYTNDEVIVLARIMQIEAGSTNAMIAVGNVIMNRVFCGRFGPTITAVVTARNQFAYKESVTPRQSAIDAAHAVLDNEVWLVPQNTYYFKGSGTEGVAWGSNPYCTTIGGNYFYTHNYGGRYNGGSVPPSLYNRVYQYAQYGCQSGERVARIQYMLQVLGYSVSQDGSFGKGTKEALAAFQQSAGLSADGVAGPATVEALINAIGIENYIAKYYS